MFALVLVGASVERAPSVVAARHDPGRTVAEGRPLPGKAAVKPRRGKRAEGPRDGKAARRQRDKAARRPSAEPLWSLYPLNPLAGETPAPPPRRDEIDPLAETPAAAPGGAVAVGAEDGSERGVAPVALVAAVALALLAVAGWMLARRPARTASGAPAVAASGGAPAATAAGPPPPPPPAPAAEQEPVGVRKDHVRVYLSDGRSIEGWRHGPVGEHRVVVLDVDDVYDASGAKVATSPRDSFLLPPQIERVELLPPVHEDARG